MAYAQFTWQQLRQNFDIRDYKRPLFDSVEPRSYGPLLQGMLRMSNKLPLMSEKARSELIVMPFLAELAEQNDGKFLIYSGIDLNVDTDAGLNGECDFILSKDADKYFLSTPVFGMVEAKKQDIDLGIPQCVAQMLGALRFNEQQGNDLNTIYGCVTTGETWQFMRLEDREVSIDTRRYYIDRPEIILGVLQQIIDLYA